MKLQTRISLAILPLMAISIFALGFFSIRVTSDQYTHALTQALEEEMGQYVEHHVMALHKMLVQNGLHKVDSFVANYQQKALQDASTLHHTDSGHFVIIQGGQNVLYCSRHSLHKIDDQWRDVVRHLKAAPDQMQAFKSNAATDTKYIVGYHFSPWDWTLVYEITSAKLLAPARKIRNLTLLVSGICTISGFLLIAWLLHKMVVTPVALLSKSTGAIAAGQTVETIPIHGSGELGGLARNMESMARAISTYRSAQSRWQKKLEQEIADQTEELRRSLNKLHRSEQFLGTVLESIKDGICVLDADLKIAIVNDTIKRRYPQITQWPGLSYSEIEPVLPAGQLCPARKSFRTCAIEHAEVRMHLPNSQASVMEVHAFPILNAEKDVIGVVQYSRDITERKEMEQRVTDALELNQKIINASSLGIVAYSHEGACILANSAAADIIGARLEDVKEQNFRHIDSWGKSGLLEQALLALEDGQQRRYEIHLISSFGREIWLNCQLARFYKSGKPHLLLMSEDITHRKILENELQDKIAELETANQRIVEQQRALVQEERLKALLQMAGATAHELNQPLMTLLGNIELMEIDPENAEKRGRHIRKIQESGQRIGEIVRKIQTIRSDRTIAYTQRADIIDLDQK